MKLSATIIAVVCLFGAATASSSLRGGATNSRRLWGNPWADNPVVGEGGKCDDHIDCGKGVWCTMGYCSSGREGQTCSDAPFMANCNSGLKCTSYRCSAGKEGQNCANGLLNANCNTGLSCISRGYCAIDAGRGQPCGDSAGGVDCAKDIWCSGDLKLGAPGSGDTRNMHRCVDSFWESGTLSKIEDGVEIVGTIALVAATGGVAAGAEGLAEAAAKQAAEELAEKELAEAAAKEAAEREAAEAAGEETNPYLKELAEREEKEAAEKEVAQQAEQDAAKKAEEEAAARGDEDPLEAKEKAETEEDAENSERMVQNDKVQNALREKWPGTEEKRFTKLTNNAGKFAYEKMRDLGVDAEKYYAENPDKFSSKIIEVLEDATNADKDAITWDVPEGYDLSRPGSAMVDPTTVADGGW